jgi:glutamyl/glutaminyl-tRNA synthetase
VQGELKTLADISRVTTFYFVRPQVSVSDIAQHMQADVAQALNTIITQYSGYIAEPKEFLKQVQAAARQENITTKDLFTFLRLALSGSLEGPRVQDILTILGPKESKERVQRVL